MYLSVILLKVRTGYANLTTASINCHTTYYTIICSVCQVG